MEDQENSRRLTKQMLISSTGRAECLRENMLNDLAYGQILTIPGLTRTAMRDSMWHTDMMILPTARKSIFVRSTAVHQSLINNAFFLQLKFLIKASMNETIFKKILKDFIRHKYTQKRLICFQENFVFRKRKSSSARGRSSQLNEREIIFLSKFEISSSWNLEHWKNRVPHFLAIG